MTQSAVLTKTFHFGAAHYHAPGFEVIALTGKGVIESLQVGMNTTLQKLERT